MGHDRLRQIQPGKVLIKISRFDRYTACTRYWWTLPENHFQQGRFPTAVWPAYRHAHRPLQTPVERRQGEIRQDKLFQNHDLFSLRNLAAGQSKHYGAILLNPLARLADGGIQG